MKYFLDTEFHEFHYNLVGHNYPINTIQLISIGIVREDGRMVHDMYLVEVKKPGESKGEAAWDLLKIKRTLKGENVFKPLSLSNCPLVKK